MMKTEPVVNPTTAVNTPIKASNGDNAETYNFKNHKAGAGQLSRMKSRMLMIALKLANTMAVICRKEFIKIMFTIFNLTECNEYTSSLAKIIRDNAYCI